MSFFPNQSMYLYYIIINWEIPSASIRQKKYTPMGKSWKGKVGTGTLREEHRGLEAVFFDGVAVGMTRPKDRILYYRFLPY